MIGLAAISLDYYEVDFIDLKKNEQFDPAADGENTGKLSLRRTVGSPVGEVNPQVLKVGLVVEIDHDEEKVPPIVGKVGISGVFSFSDQLSIERRFFQADISGASVLYGILREVVTSAAAKMSYHQFYMLPTVVFSSNKDEIEKTLQKLQPDDAGREGGLEQKANPPPKSKRKRKT